MVTIYFNILSAFVRTTTYWAPSCRSNVYSLLLSATFTTAEGTFVGASCLPERDAASLGAPDFSKKPHDPRSSQHVTSKRRESLSQRLTATSRCENLQSDGCLMLIMWLSLPEDGYLLAETCKGIFGWKSAVHKHVNATCTCQPIQSLQFWTTFRTAALFYHRNNKSPPYSNTMAVN
jgi:hypothetical protein